MLDAKLGVLRRENALSQHRDLDHRADIGDVLPRIPEPVFGHAVRVPWRRNSPSAAPGRSRFLAARTGGDAQTGAEISPEVPVVQRALVKGGLLVKRHCHGLAAGSLHLIEKLLTGVKLLPRIKL